MRHTTSQPLHAPTLIGRQAFLDHSQDWFDPQGPYAVLHQLTPLRLSWIQDIHKQTYGTGCLKNKTILDVGCGGGLLSEPLARQGAQVTGIDALEENILAGRAHQDVSETLPLTYHPLSLSAFRNAHATKKFDIITALEVIEHTPSPLAFLEDIHALLKKGGLCVLSTLDRTFFSYVQAICLAEHILNWVPKGTHDWQDFLTPAELKTMGATLGWTHLKTQGISFALRTGLWHARDEQATNFFIAFQCLS